jgi:hypothetical protein
MKSVIIALVAVSYLLSFSVKALPNEGSCSSFEMRPASDNKTVVDLAYHIHVLRDGVPVYTEEDNDKVAATLPFGERLQILEISTNANEGRIKVQRFDDTDNPIGWIERYEVLCRIEPLKSNNGLERKAFIKTGNSGKELLEGVPSYKTYDKGDGCEENCLGRLARFDFYYIVAEDTENERYLLASSPDLLKGRPLVGWVDSCDIIPWNTTLQARPDLDVDKLSVKPGILEETGLLGFACEDQREREVIKEEGVEMHGGIRWYKLPYHLPILHKTSERYQFAVPGRGLDDIEGQIRLMEVTATTLERFKNIDVFFLIDGTRSMQPYIDEVKQFISVLVKNLEKSPEHSGAKFRFGFRVYRDSFAGNDGVGEGLDFSTNIKDDKNSPSNFSKEMAKVRDSTGHPNEGGDLYPEALFKGMEQALKDMEGLPDHFKLLFIIGDHGDNKATPDKNINLQVDFNLFTAFFIQTGIGESYEDAESCFNAGPESDAGQGKVFDPKNSEHAFRRFQRQACDFLEELANKQGVPRQDYYQLYTLNSLDTRQFSRVIEDRVKDYSNIATAEKTIERLRSGQAIGEIIEANLEEGDVPVVYWRIFKEEACKELPDLCEKPPSFQDVFYAHGKVSQKWVEEIWISSDRLEQLLRLLEPLTQISTELTLTQQKENFIQLLRIQLRPFLGTNADDSSYSEKTLQEILEGKTDLPIRERSPLMQYTIREIEKMGVVRVPKTGSVDG